MGISPKTEIPLETNAMSESKQTFHFEKMKTNVRRLGYICVFVFADPTWLGLIAGSAVILLAVVLHGWAAGYLARAGRPDREDVLTVRGPYRHTRNPYYLAHLTMDFGFFLIAGLPLYYLAYFPFMFAVYRMWVIREEGYLEETFGETFETLKQNVPRWWFQLVPASPQGREEEFTWPDYIWNGELKRTLSHLCLLGLFWNFYYLGNPFLYLSEISRITIIGFVAIWIFIRDVQFTKSEELDLSWITAGFIFLVFGLISLTFWSYQPINEQWSRILSVGMGTFLLVIIAGNYVKPIRESFQSFFETTFKDPGMTIIYFFLGLGLLMGNLYVFWSGLLLAMSVQFFEAGGLSKLARVKMLSKQL
jgi:protein-S-isoprenylcysteine O-methyltransferase Ste14